jgi:hypothetical protein
LPPSELEGPQRLSQSVLWPLQRAFYARQGRAAWKTGVVPYYPTSNPFFVRSQARLMVAFLRDLAAAGALDLGQPVYLIELAAGAGQFAFLSCAASRSCSARPRPSRTCGWST